MKPGLSPYRLSKIYKSFNALRGMAEYQQLPEIARVLITELVKTAEIHRSRAKDLEADVASLKLTLAQLTKSNEHLSSSLKYVMEKKL